MTRDNARVKPQKEKSTGRVGHLTNKNRAAAQTAFLAAYSECGTIRAAARMVGVHRQRHTEWMQDEQYRQDFDTACQDYLDKLVEEIDRRALDGSDVLLMFRTKKLDNSYRERFSGDLNIKTNYDAEATAKLASTPEGRALIRQMTELMQKGDE